MLLSFTLSMPNVGSWDGSWTGQGTFYARVKDVRDKAVLSKVLEKGYYHYNFGDGWSAGVTVKQVDAKEARQIRKHSSGFCGYDWMIDSILKRDKITPESKC